MHIFKKMSMLHMLVLAPICWSLPAIKSEAKTNTRNGRTKAMVPKSPRHRSWTFIPKLPVESITTVKNRNKPTANRVMLQMTSRLRLSRSLRLCISSITSFLVGAVLAAAVDAALVSLGLFLLPGGLPGPLFCPV